MTSYDGTILYYYDIPFFVFNERDDMANLCILNKGMSKFTIFKNIDLDKPFSYYINLLEGE